MKVTGAGRRKNFIAIVTFAAKRLAAPFALVMHVNVPNQSIFIPLFKNIVAAWDLAKVIVLVGFFLWVAARVLPPEVRIMGRPFRQSEFLPLGAVTIFAQGKGRRGCSCSSILRLKK